MNWQPVFRLANLMKMPGVRKREQVLEQEKKVSDVG